jgi:hypothetical protein
VRADRVAIEELVLRVPGAGPDDAAAFAQEVIARVHARLRGTGRIGRIELAELRIEATGSRAELIEQLADRLVEVLT